MIKGIDLDTAYLFDGLYHYNFVAEFPALKAKYPDLSDHNICIEMGVDESNQRRVALLFNFDLQAESDFNKPYILEIMTSARTKLLILTPDTSKTGKNKHQLLYGWSISKFRTRQDSISYGYKTKTISPELISCHYAAKSYFQMGDVAQAPNCVFVLVETTARKPYLFNYGKQVLLLNADKERGDVVYADSTKYSGPTLDAYAILAQMPNLRVAPQGTVVEKSKPASNRQAKPTRRVATARKTAVTPVKTPSKSAHKGTTSARKPK